MATNNWTTFVDKLSEDEAGAILKYKESGVDALSEDEAAIVEKHSTTLKSFKQPQKKESSFFGNLVEEAKYMANNPGKTITGLSVGAADFASQIPKFMAGAVGATGAVLAGHKPTEAMNYFPAAQELWKDPSQLLKDFELSTPEYTTDNLGYKSAMLIPEQVGHGIDWVAEKLSDNPETQASIKIALYGGTAVAGIPGAKGAGKAAKNIAWKLDPFAKETPVSELRKKARYTEEDPIIAAAEKAKAEKTATPQEPQPAVTPDVFDVPPAMKKAIMGKPRKKGLAPSHDLFTVEERLGMATEKGAAPLREEGIPFESPKMEEMANKVALEESQKIAVDNWKDPMAGLQPEKSEVIKKQEMDNAFLQREQELQKPIEEAIKEPAQAGQLIEGNKFKEDFAESSVLGERFTPNQLDVTYGVRAKMAWADGNSRGALQELVALSSEPSATPHQKVLGELSQKLLDNPRIGPESSLVPKIESNPQARGSYDNISGNVKLKSSGTITDMLHEVVHSAVNKAMILVENGKAMSLSWKERRAVAEINRLHKELQTPENIAILEKALGSTENVRTFLGSARELAAYGITNAEVMAALKEIKTASGGSIFNRLFDPIADLFGVDRNILKVLEKNTDKLIKESTGEAAGEGTIKKQLDFSENPETIASLQKDENGFKSYLREKGYEEEVINKAWENQSKINEIDGKLQDSSLRNKAVDGILGDKYLSSITDLKDIPMEDLKPYWESGKQKDLITYTENNVTNAAKVIGNWIKKQTISGGRMMAFAEGNSFINKFVSELHGNAREAQIKIDELLYQKGAGLQHRWGDLSKQDQAKVWNEMFSKEGKEGSYENLPQELRAFAEDIQKVKTEAWQEYNAWRESTGRKPIPERINHLVGSFTGEFKSIIWGKDAAGKDTVIGVIARDTLKDAQIAADYIRQNLGEDVRIGDIKHSPSNLVKDAKDTVGLDKRVLGFSHFERFAEMASLLESEHPLAQRVNETLQGLAEKQARARAQFNVHEKFKKGVTGSAGNEPWLDSHKNAQNGMEAQFAYLDGLYQYLGFQKSAKTLQQMKELKVLPESTKYIQELFDSVHGYTLGNEISNKIINGYASATGLSGRALSEGVSAIVRNMTRSVLGWSGAYAALNLAQLGISTPTALASIKEAGVKGNIVFSEGIASSDLMLGAMQARGIKGAEAFISEPGKYFINYMREKHISFPNIIENRAFSSNIFKDIKEGSVTGGDFAKAGWEKAKNLTDFTISAPEAGIRGQFFLSFAHYLHSGGMELQVAARTADSMVSIFLGDFSKSEKAMMYNSLGLLGKTSGNVQTFTHNILSQYYSLLRKDQYLSLATILSTQALMFGYLGLPGMELVDKLQRLYREHFNEPQMRTIRELALEDPNKLLPYGAVNQAAAAIGVPLDLQVKGSQADMIRTDLEDMVFTLQGKLFQTGKAGFRAGKSVVDSLRKDTPLNWKDINAPAWELAPGFMKSAIEKAGYTDKEGRFTSPRDSEYNLSYKRTKEDELARKLGGRSFPERMEGERNFVMKNYEKDRNELINKNREKTIELISNMAFGPYSEDGKQKLGKAAGESYKKYIQASGNTDGLPQIIDEVGKRYALTPWQRNLMKHLNTEDPQFLQRFSKILQGAKGEKPQ